MNFLPDELLHRGKQRGYVTYNEVLDYLPIQEVRPEHIDAVLRTLEENGVEFLDDAEVLRRKEKLVPQSSKYPMPRCGACPDLDAALRRAGVEYVGAVGQLVKSGGWCGGRVIVPTRTAPTAWWKIRSLVPALGHWPVIVGEAEWPEPLPALEEVELIDVDPLALRSQARKLMREAERCVPDPRTFHRWHSCKLEKLSAEAWEEACREPADVPMVLDARTSIEAAPGFPFEETPVVGEEVHPYVAIELVPTTIPWEVFAYWPTGGWNGVPYPAEQLAMHRAWHERHGAELFRYSGDAYEMCVPRPPRTRAEALQLARELMGFGEETIFGYESDDCDYLAAVASRSHYWRFWWD
jgi:hypothetical protein